MTDVVAESMGALARPDRKRFGRGHVAFRWFGERPALQIAVFLGLILIGGGLWTTLAANLARLGLTPGFGFLTRAANFEIGESPISYAAGDSYGRAILAGLANTIEVSALGCVLATVLGVGVGVARLSSNPLLARTSLIYVEVLRNTPLLLQLFFWNASLHALPGPRQAFVPLPGVLLSNRGLFLPWFAEDGSSAWVACSSLAGLAVVAGGSAVFRLKHGPAPRFVVYVGGIAALLLPSAIAWGMGAPLALDLPRLAGFNIRGGLSMSPEFAALLIGLAVNASASIAETVRGAILAIPKGQWEAAGALGLRPMLVMRLVVLPQALRIVVPVLASSWLSLTKNSSLAVAIGFPDVVSILNTAANVTGQALETIVLMMAIYLALSLAVSLASNAWNRRFEARSHR